MVRHTVTWDEIKKDSLEKVLRSVVAAREILTIRLPEGEEVTIQPKPPLEPLPVLEGFVPQGWKDAVYDEPRRCQGQTSSA